ncbi:MAG: MarR family transcriptional regulator [Pseudomonadota bacterium]
MSQSIGTTDREDGIFHMLHRAEQRAKMLFADEAKGLDLTVRQLVILSVVSKHDGLMQTDIVRLTGIDRSTVTELIGRMANRGLLTRSRNQRDARAYVVQVSELGAERLREAEDASKRAGERFLAALPDAQRVDFVEGRQRAADIV